MAAVLDAVKVQGVWNGMGVGLVPASRITVRSSWKAPGGWRLIGRTPVPLYDPNQDRPALLEAGDHVRFRPVSAAEFAEVEAAVKRGSFAPDRRPCPGE